MFFDEESPDELVLRAKRILVMSRGALSVGSEERPFPGQATIELYGTHSDIELPVYGSKVGACL